MSESHKRHVTLIEIWTRDGDQIHHRVEDELGSVLFEDVRPPSAPPAQKPIVPYISPPREP